MKLAILFSGGKDSCYALYLAKKLGYEIECLISVVSLNKESFMFHTPNIKLVRKQAEVLELPLIVEKTNGRKEEELADLKKALEKAIEKYKIEGIVTGAIASVYQASRIQKICNKLGIECFNPLWQKNQEELLNELVENKFKVVIVGVFALGLEGFLGRIIDKKFIFDIKEIEKKYKINIAGEGGEFESFVLDCPMFKRKLKIMDKKTTGEGNSWSMEIAVE